MLDCISTLVLLLGVQLYSGTGHMSPVLRDHQVNFMRYGKHCTVNTMLVSLAWKNLIMFLGPIVLPPQKIYQ